MADECKGNWVSRLLLDRLPDIPIEIGSIVIDAHAANTITGNLIKNGQLPQPLTAGICIRVPSTGAATHFIVRFRARISGEICEFRGLIKAADMKVIASGTFRSFGTGPEDGDTGTWEATKMGINFGDENDRGEGQYEKRDSRAGKKRA
jgi:hypothetical protein